MLRFTDPMDAARAVLARCPDLANLGRPDDRAWGGYDVADVAHQLAAMLAAEADTYGDRDLAGAADRACEHLAGEVGPDADPRKPANVLAALATYRPLAVWCWLARFEAARRRAIDYLVLVAENDGAAYREGKDANRAVSNAWDAVNRAKREHASGIDLDDLDVPVSLVTGQIVLGDVRRDAVDAVRDSWGRK